MRSTAGLVGRWGVRMLVVASVALGLAPVAVSAAPAVVHVPGDVATIQAGIDLVGDGGEVVVAPGVYHENIDFHGRRAEVHSSGGAAATVIEGTGDGPAVNFATGETRATVLEGFTVRHGSPGIRFSLASPTVTGNIVTGNDAGPGGMGGGMFVGATEAMIRDNVIRANTATWGGGVMLMDASGTEFVGNTLEANRALHGGAMAMWSSGYPLVWNNLFRGNHADRGGAIRSVNFSYSYVVQNVFVDNDATYDGGAVHLGAGPELLGNTFLDNRALRGTAIHGSGYLATNNLITGPPSGPAVYCNGADGRYFYNDVYNGTPAPTQYCTDVTGIAGNISADPKLRADFSLGAGSPAIDAGHEDPIDPVLPPVDANGGPRVTDGNGDGVSTVDMGAFESPGGGWTPQATAGPGTIDFGTVGIGSSATLSVTVTGGGRRTAHPGTPTVTAGLPVAVTAGTCSGAILAPTESCSMPVTYAPATVGTLSATVTIPSDAGPMTVRVTGRAADLRAVRYLDRAFRDLVGRPPTAAEATAWTPAVADFGGRVNLTVGLVGSREFRAHRVAEDAQAWLGHPPDPTQAAALVDAMGQGAIVEISPALFAGSDEFYAPYDSPEYYVERLFQSLLGITPDFPSRNAIANVLRNGYSRMALAVLLLVHPAGYGHQVDTTYQRFLGHAPSADMRAFWVDTIGRGTRSEYLTAYVVATEEYWSHV